MNVKERPSISAVLPLYSVSEEIVNSVLHGVGALGATVGMVLLSLKAYGFLGVQSADVLDIISIFIFTVSMFAMFLVSTLYHAIQHKGAKVILRKLDHSIIFVFIAGTYTPFCLSALRGGWGWALFAVEWSLALLGITLNFLGCKFLKKIEVVVYIIMGWAIVVGFVPLVRSVPVQSVILLIAGGIAYTLGTVWYRKKSVRYTHAVWHVFVIIGTVCHWFSVWFII